MPSHVHPYPHGPPANVATLPAPINCTYSRSKRAVRSGLTRITVWTLLPLPNFAGRAGTLGIYSILITNQQQFFGEDTIKYCSIPSVPSGLEEVKTRPHVAIREILYTGSLSSRRNFRASSGLCWKPKIGRVSKSQMSNLKNQNARHRIKQGQWPKTGIPGPFSLNNRYMLKSSEKHTTRPTWLAEWTSHLPCLLYTSPSPRD